MLKRRRDLAELSAENILLIKPSSLGDVVQSLPVLSALRQRLPDARITWLISPPCQDIIAGHPDLDDIILFDRSGYRGRERSLWACKRFVGFVGRLRRAGFDLVVDLQGLLRSGLMTRATGAPTRVGLSSAREMAGLAYTHTVAVPTLEMSAVDRYWLVAEALGAGGLAKRFDIHVPEADARWVDEQLDGLPRPLLVVNPGARWTTKRWPTEQFASLADRFAERTEGSVVLIGGPGEEPIVRAVADRLARPALDLAGRTTLKRLTAVLRQADLVLSGDSGPMHMAAAVDAPTVAIFTCTSPVRARPYSDHAVVVATGVPCAASYVRQCDRLDCMTDITVDRVWDACARQLETHGRQAV